MNHEDGAFASSVDHLQEDPCVQQSTNIIKNENHYTAISSMANRLQGKRTIRDLKPIKIV